MIIDLLGVPQISRLDALHNAEQAGLPIATLNRTSDVSIIRPSTPREDSNLRLVFVTEIYVLNSYLEALLQKPQRHLVLVNAPPVVLEEHGIEVFASGIRGMSVKQLLAFQDKPEVVTLKRVTKVKDLSQSVYDHFNRDSLLSKLQSALYRIRNAEARAVAQSLCYRYLGSQLKRRPDTGYSFLSNILQSPLADRFREVTAAFLRGEGDLDELTGKANLDRFELAFILTRCGFDVGK